MAGSPQRVCRRDVGQGIGDLIAHLILAALVGSAIIVFVAALLH
jgi:hypothetical protein